jgi:hypothetical protein
MAVEVDYNKYLFSSENTRKGRPEYNPSDYAALLQRIKNKKNTSRAAAGTPIQQSNTTSTYSSRPFRYNPIHDLESLWWIAIYFVINKEISEARIAETDARSAHDPDDEEASTADVVAPSKLDVTEEELVDTVGSVTLSDRLAEQNETDALHLTEVHRRYARSLFYGREERWLALQVLRDNPLDNHLRSLPAYMSLISEPLIELRKTLLHHYQDIERPDFKIDKTVCKTLYPFFINAFTEILDRLEERDITVTPLRRDPQEEGIRKAFGRGPEVVPVQGASQSEDRTRSTSSKRKCEDAGSSAGSKRSRVDREQ